MVKYKERNEMIKNIIDSNGIGKKYLKSYSGIVGSVQFIHSVVSDSLQPMDCSPPGFPAHHQLPELTQTHVHRVGDAI